MIGCVSNIINWLSNCQYMKEKMSNLLYLSDLVDHDAEYIPLLSSEDEDLMNNEDLPDTLPVLPLRNTVLFPGVVIPITVGRDKSIKLIKDAYNKGNKTIAVASQKDVSIEDPEIDDIYKIGTTALILKLLNMLMVVQQLLFKEKEE